MAAETANHLHRASSTIAEVSVVRASVAPDKAAQAWGKNRNRKVPHSLASEYNREQEHNLVQRDNPLQVGADNVQYFGL